MRAPSGGGERVASSVFLSARDRGWMVGAGSPVLLQGFIMRVDHRWVHLHLV